jgi:RNA polymerase sigma factor (TIGR02999 family)
MSDCEAELAAQGVAVTMLLHKWRDGDAGALGELTPMIYGQLRDIAARAMRGDSRATLQPTMIVHEAYLRMAQSGAAPQDRSHFFAIAATVMRHVVLDWAKSKSRDKRGGGLVHETIHEGSVGMSTDPSTVIEVERLLTKLESFDARKARIVEMIFYGGLTYDEVAESVGISAVTVHRELKFAKAWMRSELEPAARTQ